MEQVTTCYNVPTDKQVIIIYLLSIVNCSCDVGLLGYDFFSMPRQRLCTSQVAHQARAYLDFCSIN